MEKKHFAKGIAYSAQIIGFGSMILFTAFLYAGSFSLLNFGFSESATLWIDTGLNLLFFIQHSAMIRKSFRRYASKLVPMPYYGAIYAVASGITLFILLIFWQKSSVIIFSASGYYRWFFRILFILSIAGFTWGTRALGSFDPFGVKNIFYHLKNKQPKIMPLAIRGPYKLVRHPLYFFVILLIWACPDLSADRLLLNVLWTIWVIIGTLLEEKDLVSEFGEAYQNYQKEVPMLIPLRIFKNYT